MPATEEIAPGVSLIRDTCNVYVLRAGKEAVLIDFGSGMALDHLDELGVERVTDVLLTHHHRDQVQGLARAVSAGIRIWAPPVERELIAQVDRHWLARPLDNDYDLRDDRFSLLEPVPLAGVAEEYRTRRYGAFEVFTLPTPGHTVGSVTYLVEHEGRRLAFSGDLLYDGGKVWSLAATQWTYTGTEGQIATSLSCALLGERRPDLLLPSHGNPIADPQAAIAVTRGRLAELVALRREEAWDFDEWFRNPWEAVTPHLLRNRTTLATSYALLSESGAALLIDWGYDLWTGSPLSADRSARRPLLATLDVLRRDFGVERIETVVTTHYHDDHVAGINLLRDVEGTEVWVPENVAPVLAEPHRYDLPCLWYDAVAADRTLVLETPVAWHEYELTAYALPGHTLYAAALAFQVDGRTVLATGDQQSAGARPILNYQYRNRFGIDDYVRSAELYAALRPDLIVGGHWLPLEVDDAVLARLLADGRRVEELHRELLPLDEVDFGRDGFAARVEPYRSTVEVGGAVELEVAVRNPLARAAVAEVRLAVPVGWTAEPASVELELESHAEERAVFRVTAGGPGSRARVAADVTVGGVPFGQQAEALVDAE
jgi:glyoxylase-like metal-dependent hydrolase (beta-lactamase superfamily II)